MSDRSKIKAKAFALFQKDGKVLMHEIFEQGKLIGYRLPGGHIEFGEKSDEAVIREIKEELNADAVNVSLISVEENIFVYEGQPGHEIVFVYETEFKDKSFYEGDSVKGFEPDNGQHFMLYWIDTTNPPQGVRIFPEGLTRSLKTC